MGVVEPFDVYEPSLRQVNTGISALKVEQFDLHEGPEGLDDGVDACIVVKRRYFGLQVAL